MRAQARFDMGDRNAGRERGQSRAQRARCVALNDQQMGWPAQVRQQRRRHLADVCVRVFLAEAIELEAAVSRQGRSRAIEPVVLAGEDQRRHDPALGERVGDWGQLDGFRPGPDDQPDIRETQPSP